MLFKSIIFLTVAVLAVCLATPAYQHQRNQHEQQWDQEQQKDQQEPQRQQQWAQQQRHHQLGQQSRSHPIQMEDTSSSESRETPANVRVMPYEQQRNKKHEIIQAPVWERMHQGHQNNNEYQQVRQNQKGERQNHDDISSEENNSQEHRNRVHKQY